MDLMDNETISITVNCQYNGDNYSLVQSTHNLHTGLVIGLM